MIAQPVMPFPMVRMLEYLKIDSALGFDLMAEKMAAAIVRCRMCTKRHTCDYDVESRYFRCPNRELFDQLEDLRDAL